MRPYNRLSHYKIEKIMRCFCEDITATSTAKLLGINRNTINRYFILFRQTIACFLFSKDKRFDGEVELDESYFGARRIRGKRGRGAAGKTPVFGVLKRHGKVYVEIVKDCSKASLMPIIQGKILEGSVCYTDGWKAYEGLIVNGYDHYRVFHSHNEFARGKSHVNGIESFWSFAKRRLAKFNGMSDPMFFLHLKECEFRHNHRDEDLFHVMKKLWKKRRC